MRQTCSGAAQFLGARTTHAWFSTSQHPGTTCQNGLPGISKAQRRYARLPEEILHFVLHVPAQLRGWGRGNPGNVHPGCGAQAHHSGASLGLRALARQGLPAREQHGRSQMCTSPPAEGCQALPQMDLQKCSASLITWKFLRNAPDKQPTTRVHPWLQGRLMLGVAADAQPLPCISLQRRILNAADPSSCPRSI